MNELPTQHALTAYMYLACWEGILHVERAYCILRGHLACWEVILHVGKTSLHVGRAEDANKWVSRAQIMECVIVVHSIAMS